MYKGYEPRTEETSLRLTKWHIVNRSCLSLTVWSDRTLINDAFVPSL